MMPTPASPNPISINNLRQEFGGTDPSSMNEYYKADVGVPVSGELSLSDFRGKTAHGSKTECGSDIRSKMGLYTVDGTYQNPANGGYPSDDVAGSVAISHVVRRYDTQAADTFARTMNGSVAVENVGNCTANTILWWQGGDDPGAISGFKVNGTAVTPTLVAASTNFGASRLYRYVTTGNTRFKDITSVGFDSPAQGNNYKQCISIFTLPNTWNVAEFTSTHTSSALNVTLEPYQIFAMQFASSADPEGGVQNPRGLRFLTRTSDGTTLTAAHSVLMKWYGQYGHSLWVNQATTTTYSVPNSDPTWGNVARHCVKITYAGNGYLNSI
jgi:hypothetical protein